MSRMPAAAAPFDGEGYAEYAESDQTSDPIRSEPTELNPDPVDGPARGEASVLRLSQDAADIANITDATDFASMSDQELLDGIRRESEVHFAELYNRYFQRIYNFVYTRMRNHAETEEVVQETFLAVFRSFGNYRGQSSLLSWIYGIAKNTTNNSLRRTKSQTERIEMAGEEELFPRSAIDVGMPDEQLDLHRFREQLSERLDTLSAWQAEIFEMRHFENLSIPEISKRTARSSDAVRSSLYRVKRMFFDTAVATGSASLAVDGGQR